MTIVSDNRNEETLFLIFQKIFTVLKIMYPNVNMAEIWKRIVLWRNDENCAKHAHAYIYTIERNTRRRHVNTDLKSVL